MNNIFVKKNQFGLVVQGEVRAVQNHLCNFGKGYYEEHFYELILNIN